MGGLRLIIVLAVGLTLLLPPRWCCALPVGVGPCGAFCRSSPGKTCCACAKQGQSKDRTSGPCKCVCKGSIAKVNKGSDSPEIVLAAFYVPATAPVNSLQPQAPAVLLDELLPPLDVQTMLRRWRC